MEEMIIAKAHCHMIMKRVRGHQYHYTEHAVCFWQNNVTFMDALPSLPKHVDIVLLRPHGAGCTFIDRYDYAIGQDCAPLDKGMGDTLV